MCIGFWSLEHPNYALILCSNRDEYLSRPTTAAHFHSFEMPVDVPEDPNGRVLSGRDLRAGGTWLGISRSGRVAFLTNITEELAKYSSTRGELVSSFLLPDPPEETLHEHVGRLVHENNSYAGFNLLLLAPSQLWSSDEGTAHGLSFDAAYVTNSGGGQKLTSRHLTAAERRCGGLSNGVDGHGADQWPKVQHGTQLFDNVLQSITPDTTDTELVERLLELLTCRSDVPPRVRVDLRNTIHIEPLQMPQPKSADGPLYGTRASTIILVHRDGSVLFVERDIWVLDNENKAVRADAKQQRVFAFHLERKPSPADDEGVS